MVLQVERWSKHNPPRHHCNLREFHGFCNKNRPGSGDIPTSTNAKIGGLEPGGLDSWDPLMKRV